MAGRALVLGGGGVTGIAWELGMLAGLADRGVDLRDADLVIGTSAGSVVGALITSGTGLEELYNRQLVPPEPDRPVRIGIATIVRWGLAAACSRGSERMGARVGKMALASVTVPEAERRGVIEALLRGRTWPQGTFLVTAVDAESGEFAAFGKSSQVGGTEVTLVDAVAASCSVPGVWPPTTIGGRRWIDGGVRSVANADLAAGYERVVVLAPIARGFRLVTGAAAQLAALRKRTRVALVTPDAAARRAIGRNLLDVARRAAAARAGRVQAGSVTAEVARVWSD
ncbi:MAG: patatin-like phospholipase family protein [Pseudonocardiales bacterium]|nr:patatin-like phospholipase family protein [Pseudonocardiales bacterium]MBV9030668.1 patatin-like phospholipase family protein [Pseudonocardiales bacterium]